MQAGMLGGHVSKPGEGCEHLAWRWGGGCGAEDEVAKGKWEDLIKCGEVKTKGNWDCRIKE